MTVETNISRAEASGNGVATVFPFTFDILDNDNLVVIVTDANGLETTVTEGAGATNYSVSVAVYPGPGSITYPASGGSPLASDERITILRVLDLVQEVDLNNQGGYFPEVQEGVFDRLTMIDQQLQEQIDRSVKVTAGSVIDPDQLIEDIQTTAAQVAVDAALVQDALDDLNLIQATTSALGIVELSTDAEAQTMADTIRAVVPANLAAVASDNSTALTGTSTTRFLTPASGRFANRDAIIIPITSEVGAVVAGTAKITFRMPYAFTVTDVRAGLTTAQASGNILTIDINEGGSTILSTKLTIDNTETTSTTAATPAVISDTALADDAVITIDVDQIGNGSAAGLKVALIGYRA